MRRIATIGVTVLGLALVSLTGVTTASAASAGSVHTIAAESHFTAAAKAKKYKNCTALHKDYQHGIRKKGAKDKVRGSSTPVATRLIPVRTPLYKANITMDRDKDGVACEAA
ncbi:hypothetical protein GCM10022223_43710 [Kineosporia mesophila]|uniref:Excalibur calcium-binding domain-containing protein n=1 Tax=Kineosporia mesophila TaxID=566012 RepID=A0ABP6ZXP4_9ACTN|nr:excalibur calcium-binding domain-containing protein [Kineosporia mesophila]MCD5353200.1 excalibur calcium-binding domain-containing protein [Kineosporia mesophila]